MHICKSRSLGRGLRYKLIEGFVKIDLSIVSIPVIGFRIVTHAKCVDPDFFPGGGGGSNEYLCLPEEGGGPRHFFGNITR